jgi:hypothetical protein
MTLVTAKKQQEQFSGNREETERLHVSTRMVRNEGGCTMSRINWGISGKLI